MSVQSSMATTGDDRASATNTARNDDTGSMLTLGVTDRPHRRYVFYLYYSKVVAGRIFKVQVQLKRDPDYKEFQQVVSDLPVD